VKPAGCTLTADGLVRQRDRIAMLRPSVFRVERGVGEIRIDFDSSVDGEMLAAWAASERDCCSFLTIDHRDQVLRIASDDPDRQSVLDGFAAVFGGGRP
jgi:hypothetical protein